MRWKIDLNHDLVREIPLLEVEVGRFGFSFWIDYFPSSSGRSPTRGEVTDGYKKHQLTIALWNAKDGGLMYTRSPNQRFPKYRGERFVLFRRDIDEVEITRITSGRRIDINFAWTAKRSARGQSNEQ